MIRKMPLENTALPIYCRVLFAELGSNSHTRPKNTHTHTPLLWAHSNWYSYHIAHYCYHRVVYTIDRVRWDWRYCYGNEVSDSRRLKRYGKGTRRFGFCIGVFSVLPCFCNVGAAMKWLMVAYWFFRFWHQKASTRWDTAITIGAIAFGGGWTRISVSLRWVWVW